MKIGAKKQIMGAVVALSLAVAGSQALAADVEAGKAKAGTCAGCHGAAGISGNDLWPNLAGQKPGYLVKQMKAFRDGTRQDPMMTSMAKPLTDADIDNLAAYYAGLK